MHSHILLLNFSNLWRWLIHLELLYDSNYLFDGEEVVGAVDTCEAEVERDCVYRHENVEYEEWKVEAD